jgi:hypothetical protein
MRTFLSYSKKIMIIFVFLLVFGRILTFFDSLGGDINTIGSLVGTLKIE